MGPSPPQATDLVLLTNGRGAMARICVDMGRVLSKYDCVLGANLHPSVPVDSGLTGDFVFHSIRNGGLDLFSAFYLQWIFLGMVVAAAEIERGRQ